MSTRSRPKIVVLDGYTLNPSDLSWEPIQCLGELEVYDRTGESEIYERAKEADILVTNKAPITSQLLGALPSLRFVSVTATGFNVVDVAEAARRSVPVSNVPEYGTDTVAQFTFALILELCHNVGGHVQSVRDGHWQRCDDWCYWLTPQIELVGKKLGIVGFGRIGRCVGELAHAFGMEIIAYDTDTSLAPSYRPFEWKSLTDVFSESDIVTLHCPQTEANRQMVNASLLGRMRRSAFLVNASRGGLIHETDLAEHLDRGAIAGAALDVVSTEPIADSNPLLRAKNCLLTPHIAWTTREARRRILDQTARNIEAFLADKPINVVNLNRRENSN